MIRQPLQLADVHDLVISSRKTSSRTSNLIVQLGCTALSSGYSPHIQNLDGVIEWSLHCSEIFKLKNWGEALEIRILNPYEKLQARSSVEFSDQPCLETKVSVINNENKSRSQNIMPISPFVCQIYWLYPEISNISSQRKILSDYQT